LPSEQWTVQPLASSWSISSPSEVTSPIVYNHQFQVTFTVVPANTGSITANSVVVVLGSPIWEPANGGGISIVASMIAGYSFTDWTFTGTITIAAPGAVSTTATIKSAGTITENTNIVTGLGFVESGIALTGPTWDVVVTAPSPIANPGLYGCSLAPPPAPGNTYNCNSVSQSIIIGDAPLGSYTYNVPTPQNWGPGVQYAYLNTPLCPCSVKLTVASPTATESVPFVLEYQLTLASNPLLSGTETASPTSSGPVGTPVGWYVSGTTIALSATPTGAYSFVDWSGFACTSACTVASNGVILNSPVTATANYLVPLTWSWSSTSGTTGVGGSVSPTITVSGGTGMITMSTSMPLPSGISIGWSQNPFQSEAAPGYAELMTVFVAPTAPYGVYTFTVYACCDSGGNSISQLFTLSVITPSVTNIGYSKSAYAVEFPGQSALLYTPTNGGHWLMFYSDGDNLVYQISNSASGTAWGGSNILYTGATEGYSFSVALSSSGTSIYIAYVTSNYNSYFMFDSGTISTFGATVLITWGGFTQHFLNPPVGLTEWASGSPAIMIDTNHACPGCVWVGVPAMDNNLNWHVQYFQYNVAWSAGKDISVNPLYSASSSPSSVHVQMMQLTDGVAIIFSVGNTPQLPTVYVIDHLDTGPLAHATLSGNVRFFEQQSQAVAVGDTIYYAGLATTNIASGASVYLFSATFTPFPGVGSCGAGPVICISAASAIPGAGTILPNAVVNHSWHVALTYETAQAALFISWGVDGNVFFAQSTDGGNSWTAPIALTGVNALVDGLTATTSGTTVGLAWIEYVSPGVYAVDFAVV